MSSHLWPLVLKCSPTGSLIFFGLYGRAVDVESSAKVTCFTNVQLRANFATDESNAVVCAARHVSKHVVGATRDKGFITVRAGAVLAQNASEYVLKRQRVVQSHYLVFYVFLAFKCSYWWILEKFSNSFVSVKNGQIIFKDAVKVLKGGVIGSTQLG